MSWEDQAYPRPWRELRDAPVVVFGSGNQRAMNDRPFAAVVGTRDCSQRAAELGFEVGRFLAGQDWGVVSGLARGVDAMAHRGACYAEGLTVACLGSPLRPIYPREHRELAGEIIRRGGGALISEHAHEAEVHRWHFAARNRLIVAMAEALVMIQSPARGGALISAQLALDSGVDCWVYRPDDRKETGKRWAGNRTILDEFPRHGMELDGRAFCPPWSDLAGRDSQSVGTRPADGSASNLAVDCPKRRRSNFRHSPRVQNGTGGHRSQALHHGTERTCAANSRRLVRPARLRIREGPAIHERHRFRQRLRHRLEVHHRPHASSGASLETISGTRVTPRTVMPF